MEPIIAYCGLKCDSCPLYLATLEQDKSQQLTMRESIVELFAKHYGLNIRPEDVADCDGCLTNTERLFSGCSDCGIRKCARAKNIESCAYCDDYACGKLREHFARYSVAEARLEEIRQLPFPLSD
jgi:hypothetical protein